GPDLSAYRWGKIASIATLAVLGGWAVTISTMFSDLSKLTGVLDPAVVTLQVASIVVFPLSLVIGLWHAARVWSGNRRWPAKLWSIALVIAFATLLWLALAFHLIGFGTQY